MVLKIIHDLACTSTILTNILLIVIIATKTTGKYRSYSIILLNFAIVEIATSIGMLLLYNRIMDTDEYLISAVEGPCRVTGSPKVCAILISWIVHFQSQYCVLLVFSFCYRYYAIHHSPPSKWRLIFILAVVYMPTTFIHIFFAPTFTATLLETNTLMAVIAEFYPEYDATKHTGLVFGSKKRGVIWFGLLWIPMLIGPIYAVIIISSVLVHRSLAFSLKMSEKSKQMHREVMKGLILQSLLPAFFVFAAVFHYATVYNLVPQWEEAGHLTLTVLSIQFAASPLITLFCIRPYRLAARSILSSLPFVSDSKQPTRHQLLNREMKNHPKYASMDTIVLTDTSARTFSLTARNPALLKSRDLSFL